MILGIALLAVSLSIDALGIGMTYGVRKIRIPLSTKLIISAISIAVTFFSLFLGSIAAALLPDGAAKSIGALILIFLGVWILTQSGKDKAPQKGDTVHTYLLRSFEITIRVIRKPQFCDFNQSSAIDPIEAVYLGLALSMDSFGAGIGSGAAGLFLPIVPFIVALVQIVFLTAGLYLGKKAAALSQIQENTWTVFSGFLLILLGIFRFL